MPTILVTGNRGAVGSVVSTHLAASGYSVRGFDLVEGQDLLDRSDVARAVAGCDSVVHLAALAHDSAGTAVEILRTNVLGTWQLLDAAVDAGIPRFVYMSSAQVLGIAEGEQAPTYLPIDDNHPRNASRPYGMSKCMAEDLCAGISATTGMTTISLRPVAVWGHAQYAEIHRQRLIHPDSEFEPFWEFGAFVDTRDVAAAVVAALTAPVSDHLRALLCASDISASAPSLTMKQSLLPAVEWRGGPDYDADPWLSLIRAEVARHQLGWSPAHTWQSWLAREEHD